MDKIKEQKKLSGKAKGLVKRETAIIKKLNAAKENYLSLFDELCAINQEGDKLRKDIKACKKSVPAGHRIPIVSLKPFRAVIYSVSTDELKACARNNRRMSIG